MSEAPNSKSVSSLVARVRALPRAMRWALAAGLAVALYFGVVEPCLNAMNRWDSRADSKEADLTKFARQAAARKDADEQATVGVTRFGIVLPPGPSSQRSQAVNQLIAKVLEDNGKLRATTSTREVPLPQNSALAKHVGQDFRVERYVSEVQFEAPPERIARVVAQLEQIPEVTSVSRVLIRQGPGGEGEAARNLRATLSVESWQLEQKGRAK